MFFSKQSIYNSELKVVANEIIAADDLRLSDEDLKTAAFGNFLNTIVEKADRHLKRFRLLVPVELFLFIRELPEDIRKKTILKVKLSSNKPENYIQAENLIAQGYKVAVDIQDRRSLEAIPHDVSLVVLDNIFMGLVSDEDMVGIDRRKLLVKNIDSYSAFEELKEQKIPFYSGRFIETPKIVTETSMSANKVAVIKLLATLNDPDVELEQVSQIISLDNIMSYKLLRVINSPLFRGVTELTSIQDAIIRFGYTNLKKWGLMLSLTSINDKPTELTRLTLERAIMCSNIAKAMTDHNGMSDEMFYTTGLFSTLDAFFDSPMQTLLNDISLDQSVRDGILKYQGETGQILKKVVNFQRGLISPADSNLTEIYVDSNQEAKQTFKLLGIDDD
jgi:EAL and modified HD-GYP domain-containing signal transduction protein